MRQPCYSLFGIFEFCNQFGEGVFAENYQVSVADNEAGDAHYIEFFAKIGEKACVVHIGAASFCECERLCGMDCLGTIGA